MVGEAIRQIRKRKGLRQIDVAKSCGWSSGVPVSKYETGDRTPSEKTLEKIADALGVTTEDIERLADKLSDERATDRPDDNEPTPGRTVRTAADASRWVRAIDQAELGWDVRALLKLLPSLQADEEDWPLVVTSRAELVEEQHVPAEVVDEHWDGVLETDFVERVKGRRWVLRMVFPED